MALWCWFADDRDVVDIDVMAGNMLVDNLTDSWSWVLNRDVAVLMVVVCGWSYCKTLVEMRVREYNKLKMVLTWLYNDSRLIVLKSSYSDGGGDDVGFVNDDGKSVMVLIAMADAERANGCCGNDDGGGGGGGVV